VIKQKLENIRILKKNKETCTKIWPLALIWALDINVKGPQNVICIKVLVFYGECYLSDGLLGFATVKCICSSETSE